MIHNICVKVTGFWSEPWCKQGGRSLVAQVAEPAPHMCRAPSAAHRQGCNSSSACAHMYTYTCRCVCVCASWIWLYTLTHSQVSINSYWPLILSFPAKSVLAKDDVMKLKPVVFSGQSVQPAAVHWQCGQCGTAVKPLILPKDTSNCG